MTSTPRLAAIAAAVLLIGIGTTAVAQSQTGANGSDIKSVLLRPAGWKVDWVGSSGSGTAEFVYEARGQEVAVRIQALSRSDGASVPKCERDVKINSDGMSHDGCMDYGITFRFDAKDQDYPFRGKSVRGYEYKLKPK